MANNNLVGVGSESKQLATWYFTFAAIIFGAQLLFGLVAAIQFVQPSFLYEVIDFSIARILHINALVVWMVFAMFGSTILVPTLIGIDPAVALFTAGLGTLIYMTVTSFKVPVFIGSSFAYIPILSYLYASGNPGEMSQAVIIVGLLYVLVAMLIIECRIFWD